jgi:hypothetical protein
MRQTALPRHLPTQKAKLMARLGEEFPLECPGCGGDIRLIAFMTDPGPIRKILTHLGEPLEPPPVSPARGPPTEWGEFVQVHDDWNWGSGRRSSPCTRGHDTPSFTRSGDSPCPFWAIEANSAQGDNNLESWGGRWHRCSFRCLEGLDFRHGRIAGDSVLTVGGNLQARRHIHTGRAGIDGDDRGGFWRSRGLISHPPAHQVLGDDPVVGEAGLGRAPLAEPNVTSVDRDAGPAAGFVVLKRRNGTLGTTWHDALRKSGIRSVIRSDRIL